MFGMIFDTNWNEKQPINSSFWGVSGCRHTPFFRYLRTYGDYLKEFKKSKAEQAAKVLKEI